VKDKGEDSMKKVMFNDKYGLTQAVLDGRKTMTRRIVPERYLGEFPNEVDLCEAIYNGHAFMKGEVVAVAQAYKDILSPDSWSNDAGFANKMFVKANLMPHKIRITSVRVERLQDISDEDCLREGIMRKWIEAGSLYHYYLPGVPVNNKHDIYSTPIDAFAALIDKISGKGTWYKNPFVFVYEFELVK